LPLEPLSDEEENNVALKMTNREVDGVSVVALDGRIVLGEESNALREKVKSLIAEGKRRLSSTWTHYFYRQRRPRHARGCPSQA